MVLHIATTNSEASTYFLFRDNKKVNEMTTKDVFLEMTVSCEMIDAAPHMELLSQLCDGMCTPHNRAQGVPPHTPYLTKFDFFF